MLIKGQFCTQLFVGQNQESEPITYKTMQVALQAAGWEHLSSSFFLLDILELDGKPFVIALESVAGGTEWPDRLAYLVHLNATMQPEVDCIRKTVICGDQCHDKVSFQWRFSA